MSEKISEATGRSESVLVKSEERTKLLTSDLSPMSIEGIFTVETFSKFSPRELNQGDRAYVRTDSGNTYRLERSRSRPGFIKFHNEQTNSQEYGTPTRGHDPNIEVGKEMHFTGWKNPDDQKEGYTDFNSSRIREIEVWRNYAQALDDANTEAQRIIAGKGLGAGIAAAATNVAKGTRVNRDYRAIRK